MTVPVLHGLSILVVEDDLANAAMYECLMQSMGATMIGPAGTLAEAMALADGHRFDLALVDYLLNADTAMPLVQVLERRNQPYVIVTGALLDTLPPALAHSKVVSKPFEVAALVNAMAEVLQKKSEAHCIRTRPRVESIRRAARARDPRPDLDNLQEAAE